MCRLLPESVVWLYANNRVAEAEQIIRDAAKLNNITMPDKILVHPDTAVTTDREKNGKQADDASSKREKSLSNLFNFRSSENTKEGSARYTIVDIFRNRRLAINIFCISFLWSVRKYFRT